MRCTTMNTRNTRNSRSAAYDALPFVQESEEIPPESVSAPSEPSVASTALCSTSVASPMSPAFLAVVTNAVQQVLSAQQAASLPAWSLPTSLANSASLFAPSANLSGNHSSLLAAHVSSFAASGAGFASSVPATAIPSASGRPNNCVVPTFVSTFSSPIPLLAQSALSQHSHRGLSLEDHWPRIVCFVAGFTSTIQGGPWFFSCTSKIS